MICVPDWNCLCICEVMKCFCWWNGACGGKWHLVVISGLAVVSTFFWIVANSLSSWIPQYVKTQAYTYSPLCPWSRTHNLAHPQNLMTTISTAHERMGVNEVLLTSSHSPVKWLQLGTSLWSFLPCEAEDSPSNTLHTAKSFLRAEIQSHYPR